MKYKGSHISLLLPRMYVFFPTAYTLFFLCYSPFSQIIYLSPFFPSNRLIFLLLSPALQLSA